MVKVYLKIDLIPEFRQFPTLDYDYSYIDQTFRNNKVEVFVPKNIASAIVVEHGEHNPETYYNESGSNNASLITIFKTLYGTDRYAYVKALISDFTFDANIVAKDTDIFVESAVFHQQIPSDFINVVISHVDYFWQEFEYENYLFDDEDNEIDLSKIDLREFDVRDLYESDGGDDNIQLPESDFDFKSGVRWNSEEIFDGGEGRDTLTGSDSDDNIHGGAGDYADWLRGGRGNDWLKGGDGQDKIDGGEGLDIAAFDFARSWYTIRHLSNNRIEITQFQKSKEILINIESLSFSDGIKLDPFGKLPFDGDELRKLTGISDELDNMKGEFLEFRGDSQEIMKLARQDVLKAGAIKAAMNAAEFYVGEYDEKLAAIADNFKVKLELLLAPDSHKMEAAMDVLESSGDLVYEFCEGFFSPKVRAVVTAVEYALDAKEWKDDVDEFVADWKHIVAIEKKAYSDLRKAESAVANMERKLLEAAAVVDEFNADASPDGADLTEKLLKHLDNNWEL